jgi:hypothetical protein
LVEKKKEFEMKSGFSIKRKTAFFLKNQLITKKVTQNRHFAINKQEYKHDISQQKKYLCSNTRSYFAHSI